MLKEIANVHQRPGEPQRRWFHTSGQDLFVWTGDTGDAADIVAFEYCYVDNRKEMAVVWKHGSGLSCYRVDQGESSVLANRSPLLERAATPDLQAALERFADASAALPRAVAGFIQAKLEQAFVS